MLSLNSKLSLNHPSRRKPVRTILQWQGGSPSVNMTGILSDPQGRPPIICLGTDFLNSFPGLGNSWALGIMIVLALATPTGD